VKITPSNQTLILAGERRGPGAPSGNSPAKTAANSGSAGSVLQRVTIVAARPDTTVLYLRADYSPATNAVRNAAATGAPRTASRLARPTSGAALDTGSTSSSTGATPGTSPVVWQSASATRDAYGNAFSSNSSTPGLSSYLHPVEQYAQTQRILGVAPRVTQIDVHA